MARSGRVELPSLPSHRHHAVPARTPGVSLFRKVAPIAPGKTWFLDLGDLAEGEHHGLNDPQAVVRRTGGYFLDRHDAAHRMHLDGPRRPVSPALLDPAEPTLALTREAIRQLQAGWDVIKLCGRPREHVVRRRRLPAGAHAPHGLIHYARVPSLTCAYVVSRRGAHKLPHSRVPFGRPIDVDLRQGWENGLAVCGVQPDPVRRAACSLVSTLDAGRRGCTGPAMRAHKVMLQARYSLLNWRHAGRQGRPEAARHAEPRVGDPVAHRDAA